jgi:hypothetical protein
MVRHSSDAGLRPAERGSEAMTVAIWESHGASHSADLADMDFGFAGYARAPE